MILPSYIMILKFTFLEFNDENIKNITEKNCSKDIIFEKCILNKYSAPHSSLSYFIDSKNKIAVQKVIFDRKKIYWFTCFLYLVGWFFFFQHFDLYSIFAYDKKHSDWIFFSLSL